MFHSIDTIMTGSMVENVCHHPDELGSYRENVCNDDADNVSHEVSELKF
jgi:hypothetical protein